MVVLFVFFSRVLALSLSAGLILERKSSREVYAIGSIASALGLGYVSLAIGKVRQ